MHPFLLAAVLVMIATNCSAQIVESVEIARWVWAARSSPWPTTAPQPGGIRPASRQVRFRTCRSGRAVTDLTGSLPDRRDRVSWFAATAPAVGFSYYRLRITDIRGFGPTGQPSVDREDTRAEASVRSISVNELGLTVVQSVLPGIRRSHIEIPCAGRCAPPSTTERVRRMNCSTAAKRWKAAMPTAAFDLDAGVIGAAGPVRVGVVMRNIREPEFGDGAFVLPRQTRVGAAIDAAKAGGPPLILAVDADVRTYATGSGDRRVVAVGAEQWLAGEASRDPRRRPLQQGWRAGTRDHGGRQHCGPQRCVCRGSRSCAAARTLSAGGASVRE